MNPAIFRPPQLTSRNIKSRINSIPAESGFVPFRFPPYPHPHPVIFVTYPESHICFTNGPVEKFLICMHGHAPPTKLNVPDGIKLNNALRTETLACINCIWIISPPNRERFYLVGDACFVSRTSHGSAMDLGNDDADVS